MSSRLCVGSLSQVGGSYEEAEGAVEFWNAFSFLVRARLEVQSPVLSFLCPGLHSVAVIKRSDQRIYSAYRL